MSRLRLSPFAFLILALFAGVFPACGETAFRITATPYAAKEERWSQALIFRELVRQAVFISASQEMNQWAVDDAFDGYDAPGLESSPCLHVDTHWQKGRLTATLRREGGAAGAPYELAVDAGGRTFERVEAIARGLVPLMRTSLPVWLRETFPAVAGPAEEGLLDEARVKRLEREPSPFAAFELLRHWHARGRKEGARPEILAGLARAYVVLGESSRHAWSAFPMACDARALLYLALLEEAHPQNPLTVDTRAWVCGLAGYHALAVPALDALATRANPPPWLPLLDGLVRYRTTDLVTRARAGGEDASFAAWLALITLEYQGTPNRYDRYYQELRELVPHNLRPTYAACNSLGVSGLHDATRHGLVQWSRTSSTRLLEVGGLPKEMRAAAMPAPAAPPTSVLTILARAFLGETAPENPMVRLGTMRGFYRAAEGHRNEGYPSWTTLGRVAWDTQFAVTVHRLLFMVSEWSVSTEEEVSAMTGDFTGHPLASVIASLKVNESQQPDPAVCKQVLLGDVVEPMLDYLAWMKPKAPNLADRTTEVAYNECWWYCCEDIYTAAFFSMYEGPTERANAAPKKIEASPWNPRFLASAILKRKDWERYRRDAVSRLPDNPVIQTAIGERLIDEGQVTEGATLLEKAIPEVAEKYLYEILAETYLDRGDEAKWLAMRKIYSDLPDAGLGHASNAIRISNHYLRTRRPALAKAYAEDAAESWAEWAMTNAILVSAVLGDYPNGEKWLERRTDRYGDKPGKDLTWWILTGRGEPESLLARMRVKPAEAISWPRNLELLGRRDEALPLYVQTYQKEGDNYYLVLAALAALEQGDKENATRILERIGAEFAKNKKKDFTRVANRDLALLMTEELAAPRPAKDFTDAFVALCKRNNLNPERRITYEGDLHYFAARFLRLRGDSEAAREHLTSASLAWGQPDLGRYVSPMIAMEWRLQGRDWLDLYRPEAKNGPEAANPVVTGVH